VHHRVAQAQQLFLFINPCMSLCKRHTLAEDKSLLAFHIRHTEHKARWWGETLFAHPRVWTTPPPSCELRAHERGIPSAQLGGN
jgi:hypothetical protein